MDHPLDGVRAKLSRANGHRHAIKNRVELWRENKPNEFIYDEESETGWTILRVRIREPPPIEIGVLVGDYVHNVRSALDHLVWQLVLANNALPGKHNEFPIALTEDYFIERALTGPKAMLARVPENAQRFIASQQPYEGGSDPPSHPLAILQELWNADKHRAVAQTVTLFEAHRTPNKHLGGSGIEPPTSRPIEDGMELNRWPTPPPKPPPPPSPYPTAGTVRGIGRTETGVVFGESKITLETLATLREDAKAITDHFAASTFR